MTDNKPPENKKRTLGDILADQRRDWDAFFKQLAQQQRSVLEPLSQQFSEQQQAETNVRALQSPPINRKHLWEEWRSRHPEHGSVVKLCKEARVHPSDFRKWRSGDLTKFPDESLVSQRIVDRLTKR